MAVSEQLLEILSEHGSIDQIDLTRLVNLHQEKGGSFASMLLDEKLISEDDLFFLLSRHLGVPAIPEQRLLYLALSPEIRRRVTRNIALKGILVPLDLDIDSGILSVAMFDPSDFSVVELLRDASQVAEIRPYLARRSVILTAVKTAYGPDVEDIDNQILERLESLGQQAESKELTQASQTLADLDPSPDQAKVEIDPELVNELSEFGVHQSTSEPTYGGSSTGLNESPMIEESASPMELVEDKLDTTIDDSLILEVVGHSLIRQNNNERPILSIDEQDDHDIDTDPFTPLPKPEEDNPFAALMEDSNDIDDEITQVRVSSGRASEGIDDTEPVTRLIVNKGIPSKDPDDEMKTRLTRIRTVEKGSQVDPAKMGLSAGVCLPSIHQMGEIDSLLRELLASVGILVSMLEERIDPVGGIYKEYGRLSRLIARELGLDETVVERVALSAHLYGLDMALRQEVGTASIMDVTAVFSNQPTAPGGLGPSLRNLGAKVLGLDENQTSEPMGLRIIRLIAEYSELRAESDIGLSDQETVLQLLRTGGKDPMLVDALVRAVEIIETPCILSHTEKEPEDD